MRTIPRERDEHKHIKRKRPPPIRSLKQPCKINSLSRASKISQCRQTTGNHADARHFSRIHQFLARGERCLYNRSESVYAKTTVANLEKDKSS